MTEPNQAIIPASKELEQTIITLPEAKVWELEDRTIYLCFLRAGHRGFIEVKPHPKYPEKFKPTITVYTDNTATHQYFGSVSEAFYYLRDSNPYARYK